MSDMSKLEFDLSKITAGEMTDFFAANKEQDYRAMSKTFAQTCIGVPEGWGDPKDPKTFIDRPMFGKSAGSFRSVIEAFVKAADKASGE